MKKKCKLAGCYEPADCQHGFCGKHCQKNHPMHKHTRRTYPKTSAPHIGVEIEVEFPSGLDCRRAIPLHAHQDGSLPDHSAEFKVLAPATKIYKKAATLANELWARRAKATRRCGLHIHVDCRNVSRKSKEGLYQWARATQDYWFSLMPPSRRENQYVLKLSADYSTHHYLWLHETNYDTMEVRLHPGTINPHKLEGWISAMIHLQNKLRDPAYVFPTRNENESDRSLFWRVFHDCPKAGKEYLETRERGNGIITDYAYNPVEEI